MTDARNTDGYDNAPLFSSHCALMELCRQHIQQQVHVPAIVNEIRSDTKHLESLSGIASALKWLVIVLVVSQAITIILKEVGDSKTRVEMTTHSFSAGPAVDTQKKTTKDDN